MIQRRSKLLACVAGVVMFGCTATAASAHGLLAQSSTAVTGQTLQGVQVAVSGGPYSHAAAHPMRHLRQWRYYQQLWHYQPVRALGALDGRHSA